MPLIQWIIQNLSVQEVEGSANLESSGRLLSTGTIISPPQPQQSSDKYSLGVTYGILDKKKIRIGFNFFGNVYEFEKPINDEISFGIQEAHFMANNRQCIVLEEIKQKL